MKGWDTHTQTRDLGQEAQQISMAGSPQIEEQEEESLHSRSILGVFQKQQEGSWRYMATTFFNSLKGDVEEVLDSASRKTSVFLYGYLTL